MKNQTFGIEVETTGLGRRGTAEAIAAYFGTTARYIGSHLSNWVIPMPDGRKWTVESDGSVTDPSAEVVSPVCRWEDIEMVQEVIRHIREAGAKVDSTCGIHIHVGLGQHTPQSLRRLVNIVNAKDVLSAERHRHLAAFQILQKLLMVLYINAVSICNLYGQFVDLLGFKNPAANCRLCRISFLHRGAGMVYSLFHDFTPIRKAAQRPLSYCGS